MTIVVAAVGWWKPRAAVAAAEFALIWGNPLAAGLALAKWEFATQAVTSGGQFDAIALAGKDPAIGGGGAGNHSEAVTSWDGNGGAPNAVGHYAFATDATSISSQTGNQGAGVFIFGNDTVALVRSFVLFGAGFHNPDYQAIYDYATEAFGAAAVGLSKGGGSMYGSIDSEGVICGTATAFSSAAETAKWTYATGVWTQTGAVLVGFVASGLINSISGPDSVRQVLQQISSPGVHRVETYRFSTDAYSTLSTALPSGGSVANYLGAGTTTAGFFYPVAGDNVAPFSMDYASDALMALTPFTYADLNDGGYAVSSNPGAF